jgi:hypothetical protein
MDEDKWAEVKQDETRRVTLWYPGRRPDGTSTSAVRIELDHVRAADNIVVRYDFTRDGWVIYMDETRDRGGYMETVREDVEVAFVPAWNEARDISGADS